MIEKISMLPKRNELRNLGNIRGFGSRADCSYSSLEGVRGHKIGLKAQKCVFEESGPIT